MLDADQYPDYPLDELLADLKQRSFFSDGIVVSGGEPTLAAVLERFLERVKALGLEVKLDSNGLLPQVLERLLARKLVDYLAIDLKTSPVRYAELQRGPVDAGALLASCWLVIDSALDYEFRTTCVLSLVDEMALEPMGEALQRAGRGVLQQHVPHQEILDEVPSQTYETTALARLQQIAEPM